MIPIMASSEIMSEQHSDDGSVEIISRKCKLHVEAPYLLKKLMGVEYIIFVQTNTLDRRKRTLSIEAFNESFSSRVVINENCKYTVHPEHDGWTCFEQTASLDIKSFFGFESTVEKIAMKQYSQNISKGKEIIEYFIDELHKDGITQVARWEDPHACFASISASETASSGLGLSESEGSHDNVTIIASTSAGAGDLRMGSSAANLPSGFERKLSISEDPMFKLDADYIKLFLGDLTPLQESRLIQLKKWVAELQKGKVPSDTTLLRFLRARDFSIEKAREMLSHSLLWRKKNQVDKILNEYQVPQVVKDYFPGGWHFHDKEGRPLYLLRLGQMDVKGLIKSVGEDGLLKHTLHICEEGLRLTEEATRTLGRPITTWTLLVDLEGLNMRHLWRPGIRTLLSIIEIVEANYPETMSCVLIIRAPRVFPILWTLVSTFIDENTRSKFLFYGGNDYQGTGGLVDYMPNKYIPDFLGGTCRRGTLAHCGLVPEAMYTVVYPDELERSLGEAKNLRMRGTLAHCGLVPEAMYTVVYPDELERSLGEAKNLRMSGVVEGGHVPKSMYLPGEELDAGRQHIPFSDQSIYQSVSLTRGQVHEVQLLVEDAGAVICWDFDVMKCDVSFCVLRTKVPIVHRNEVLSQTGAQSMIEAVIGTDEIHRSVVEKTWREGHEYFRVESNLVCHDGESIQGSHVTAHMGTYVLQWRYYESTHHTSPLDIIDSITSPKAKIMYYFETLKSADYKGSMTSLQSCQSGFSSLSASNKSGASSCPSR